MNRVDDYTILEERYVAARRSPYESFSGNVDAERICFF